MTVVCCCSWMWSFTPSHAAHCHKAPQPPHGKLALPGIAGAISDSCGLYSKRTSFKAMPTRLVDFHGDR